MSGPISPEALQHQICELYRPAPRGHWRRRVQTQIAQWLGRNDVRLFWTAEEEAADERSVEKYSLYGRTAAPRYVGFTRRLDRGESVIMALLVPHVTQAARRMEDMIQPPALPLPSKWRRTLTARQAEAALLAAVGLTDREIAEHLGVAPRTVARLLQEVFKHLGIHNRHELAADLAQGPHTTPIDPVPARKEAPAAEG
jgi:DNA-binding CsgD family transcriptional regulator